VCNAQIKPEVKVLIGLWRLAHGEGYAQLGERFGVGHSTAHRCTMAFCEAMEMHFTDDWVASPTGDRIKECIAWMSKRGGLPQAALAVNGCHIPITAPHENPGDYYNRKGFYSMNMQGLVDADCAFATYKLTCLVGHMSLRHGICLMLNYL
jgi:hypothetical protein